MRITNGMLTARTLRDLQSNYGAMARAQEQVSSGKRLNRPSDDPFDVQQAVRVNDSLASITQYLRNIQTAQRYTSTAETALASAGDIVQRLRELALQAANGSLGAGDRANVLAEAKQLGDQLASLANTKLDSDYVFSGQRTTTPAFAAATAPYGGDTGALNARIAPGVTLQVNVTGDAAFAPALAGVDALVADLTAGTPTSAATIGALDTGLDQLLTARTKIGAIDKRLTETESFMTDTQNSTTKMLSTLQDADMASAISEAATRQTTYQAAIAVNARILQKSLIDEL